MDIYYYDADTNKKQAFATTQNTKYVQAFANLNGGSSVFTIPPNNGIQDIVLNFQTLAQTGVDCSGLALPRGWGYAMIKQVSFRYGGSSQYFLTGDQILQNALRRQTNRMSANDILTLGGNSTVDQEFNIPQIANVVLTLPHSVPSAVNKANPLPSDLLTQQIQITVELNPVSSVYSVLRSTATPPAAGLAAATFQVQQVMLNNQSDALARRVDMAENAYAYPCEFVQQIQRIPLGTGAAFSAGSVVLTGFRSGEVKSIQLWLTRSTETAPAPTIPRVVNPFNWYPLTDVEMTYAGDLYARYDASSWQLWNLINGNKTPLVDNIVLANNAGTASETPTPAYYVELPFAQTLEGEGSMNTLVHGKPITNGIVNLQITCPSAQTDWVLNVSYVYNSTLLFSSGTCDYVF
jgi:hypothetical protein